MISAIILAGGLGTRLREAVPDLPKPMAPIANRPFLEYQLDYWIAQGIRHFILSIGYQANTITTHFGNSYKTAKLDYVIEDTPLGTGGALLLASEKIPKDSFALLLNGDTYFSVNLLKLVNFANEKNADWCFSLYRTYEQDRYMGIELDPSGAITSFNSGTASSHFLINGGVYLFKPKNLKSTAFFSDRYISLENDIFPALLKSKTRLYALEFNETFIDIGIPEDYRHAQTILNN